MFVLEALLLTFMTTPAVTLLYPPEMRVRVDGAAHADGAQGTEGAAQRAEGFQQGREDDGERRSRQRAL